MKERYLESTRKQFEYYKVLGERTFQQLLDKHLFYELSPEANSIAVIVNHLSGNMKSRFMDFLTSDGEKEWRNRDSEFEDKISTREDLLDKWEEGWNMVFHALDQVDDIEQIVYIRNQEHTVFEALNRQLAHYAYHIGQVVYIGKCCLVENWESLSIPINASQSYNDRKFSQKKKDGHFTDEFLGKE